MRIVNFVFVYTMCICPAICSLFCIAQFGGLSAQDLRLIACIFLYSKSGAGLYYLISLYEFQFHFTVFYRDCRDYSYFYHIYIFQLRHNGQLNAIEPEYNGNSLANLRSRFYKNFAMCGSVSVIGVHVGRNRYING